MAYCSIKFKYLVSFILPMAIRKAKEADYKKLVKLYSSFFKVHNIFQQDDEKVLLYLKKEAQKNELTVYEEGIEIKAALFLVMLGKNADGTHKLWKFRHFAYESDKIASQLLAHAEQKVKEKSKTAKIELNIAETEKGIDFLKSKGYSQEGELKNHYRWGESCFVLSKSFSG